MTTDDGVPEVRWSPIGQPPTDTHRLIFDALFRMVELHTVIVVFYDEADCELKHGTGTCVAVGDHRLVATAGHHFVREPLPAHVGLWAPTMPASLRIPAVLTHREGGLPEDEVDLAWLEVEPSYAVALGRRFLPIDGLEPSFRGDHGDHLFIFGYAGAPSVSDGEDGRPAWGLTAAAHWSTAIGRSSIDPKHRPVPDTDIFMRYTRGADDPRLEGTSGAGLWTPNLRHDNWSPECARLVGIQFEALDVGGWVRATRVARWLRPLADLCPEVRSEVARALSSDGEL